MKKLIIYQLDSFTKEKFKGNPAGVVINADGLDKDQMQLIARELNNSETAFLFTKDANDCDGVIRYFTPKTEVPTCGHATIAAMYAKALEMKLDSCILKIKTKVGVLPFEIIRRNNDYRIVMTQRSFKLNSPLEKITVKKIISSLGLNSSDLEEKCPVQIASTGHSKVMIGIKSRDTLNSLKPNLHKLSELSSLIKCNGYFVFTFDSNNKDILTYGRMFAPAIGINEDPVTGNANGPLGGYLVQNKIAGHNGEYFEFNGGQGEAINRFGIVNVHVKINNGKPKLIQIKGDAVVIFRTELYI
jgi:PhzF family phenazine biosynthesis protein